MQIIPQGGLLKMDETQKEVVQENDPWFKSMWVVRHGLMGFQADISYFRAEVMATCYFLKYVMSANQSHRPGQRGKLQYGLAATDDQKLNTFLDKHVSRDFTNRFSHLFSAIINHELTIAEILSHCFFQKPSETLEMITNVVNTLNSKDFRENNKVNKDVFDKAAASTFEGFWKPQLGSLLQSYVEYNIQNAPTKDTSPESLLASQENPIKRATEDQLNSSKARSQEKSEVQPESCSQVSSQGHSSYKSYRGSRGASRMGSNQGSRGASHLGSHKRENRNEFSIFTNYNTNEIFSFWKLIRNILNHWPSLTADLQNHLGERPNQFLLYITSRFPGFVITIFQIASKFGIYNIPFNSAFSSEINNIQTSSEVPLEMN